MAEAKKTEQPKTAEKTAETLPATQTAQSGNAPKLVKVGENTTFRLVKRVNRILLKHADDATVYVRFETAVREGKEMKTAKDGGTQMAPARLATVIDLTTGEEMDYIVGSVAEGVLNEEYPNNGYVGKSFAIRKTATSKRYKAYDLAEIEPA